MKEAKQISLFESEHIDVTAPPEDGTETADLFVFEVGDRVRIHNQAEQDEDPESYFYLRDFEGQRGEVMKVIKKPTLHYEVSFNLRVAFVYHQELKKGWPPKKTT